YIDDELYGGGTYYYVVKAVDNGSNESTYSNEDNAAAADLAPAVPANLVATATPGVEETILEWDDNSESDLAGYDVYRSTDSGGSPAPYAKINGTLVATSNYTDNTVTELVTYYYVVKAVDNGANESANSNEDNAIADKAPAAPTNLAATPGEKQITLNWDDNSETDLAGYNVYRSTDTGGSPIPYTKINATLVGTNNYNDTGLTGGITYYYVVKAVDNGANESTDSNEDNATPDGITILNDGFEGTPWDVNWDENGTTDWQVSWAGGGYGGSTYSASHASGDTYLTSDDLNTSDAASITVTFRFYIKLLNKGPLYVQTYNGTGYNNWYELVSYPGVVRNTWIQFSQTITDSQYFRSDFRIRFDGAGMATNAFIDDVIVIKN
ncbi:fibronectin type III domain-containing protein, partial [Chloroflexota bacterium]